MAAGGRGPWCRVTPLSAYGEEGVTVKPPIPISPIAWWLLELAVSALALRWAWRAIKGLPFAFLALAAAAFVYFTVPGAGGMLHGFWLTEGPRIMHAVTVAGEAIANGILHVATAKLPVGPVPIGPAGPGGK